MSYWIVLGKLANPKFWVKFELHACALSIPVRNISLEEMRIMADCPGSKIWLGIELNVHTKKCWVILITQLLGYDLGLDLYSFYPMHWVIVKLPLYCSTCWKETFSLLGNFDRASVNNVNQNIWYFISTFAFFTFTIFPTSVIRSVSSGDRESNCWSGDCQFKSSSS